MRLRTPSRRSIGVPGTDAEAPPGFEMTAEDLSLGDSFVLGVLRGFRLLQSAGLSADEKRDILSATKGSLDFEQISRALQTLWDEQFLGRAHQAPPAAFGAHYIQEELYYQDAAAAGSEWPEQEAYWTSQGPSDDWDDPTWWSDHYEAQTQEQEDSNGAAEDPEFLDAQKAEQEAEALAMQAQRTWSEAQKATQALRRDRGFGHVQTSKGNSGCFICGGPHGYRDCPDKNHPSNFRGKGKPHYGFMADYDSHELYYMKGKSKGGVKGKKGKNLHVMDAYALWKGKGKSKSKPSRPAVNAYTSEMFYGLEMQPPLELHATSSASLKPGCSLIDCGATASAGPEESVKGLISSILAVDKGASVSIAKYMRPFFRFGNGKWGQANYKVSITSSVSGSPRSFHMYCLPNPDDVKQPGFNKNSLVPVLLGMDHLSGKDAPESAMTVDFATGLALDSNNPKPDIYQLQSNSKGHYVRDIVYYLTQGFSNPNGTPSITVHEGEIQSAELQTLEFHPVEFYDISISERELDEECRRRSEQHLLALHAASHGKPLVTRSAANLASMHQNKHVTFNSIVSASPFQAMDRELPRQHQRDIVDFIKESTPAKAPSRPLDHTRIMDMNASDPRMNPEQWPCYGNHVAMKPHSNAHGEWVQCAVCNLRLRYTPKKGSPSNSTKSENPHMVARMLQELQLLMRGCRPTSAICLAMQKKIDAEEVLMHAIDKEIWEQRRGQPAYPKAATTPMTSPTSRKSPMTTPPRTPPRSHQSWDMVSSTSEAPQHLTNDLENHLTAEEKEKLAQLIRQRKQAVPDGSLAKAYEAGEDI